MKPKILSVPLILAIAAVVFGQSNSSSVPRGNDSAASKAWADILALSPKVTPASSILAPAQAKAEQSKRAAQSRTVAKAAKDFYSTYPADPRAAQAKKLEASSSLRGVVDNDVAYDQVAIAAAQAYREDTRNPIADRIDIAIEMERLKLARRTNQPVYSRQPRELEKIATDLRLEFNSHPRVFDFYAEIARTGDQTTAYRIALLVDQAPATPEAKSECRAILNRARLIGHPFTLAPSTLDGTVVDLARHSDKPTVVLLYSAATNPNSILAPKRFEKNATIAACHWVYIAINSTAKQVESVKAKAPFPGIYCALSSADTASLLDRLQQRHFPFIYLVNRRGLLTGFGPVEELPGLVFEANR